jgi:para-aminobenzoate synthetase component 1
MSHPAVALVADPPAPEAVFESLAHLPYALWLDSTADAADTGGWSFIAADPFAVLRARDGQASWVTADGIAPLAGSPFAALGAALERMRSPVPPPIPFDGGAAGFISYEAAGAFETLPPFPPRDHDLPDVHLAFYDVVAGWNHVTGECRVVSSGRPAAGPEARRRADRRLIEALGWVAGESVPGPGVDTVVGSAVGASAGPARHAESATVATRSVEGLSWLGSTMSGPEYEEAVERVIDAIRDGEVYQVNLSQRFTVRTSATPLDVHRELRRRSPAPYGAVLRVGDATIVSSSPERFLRVDGEGVVEARPIKGTRPRGADPLADARLADELRASAKDRAENLMIVDLIRNDLSRVCRPGSIRVPELFRLDSWATVHHLVSVVRGRLREGVGPDELLRATFPCGSVTGAPKIRAMELIARHERVARGPYCGAIGYFGFGGGIDLSVAIRILVAEGERVGFHAGGGIVYDSDPADEYRETLTKARAIIASLEAARQPGDGRPQVAEETPP